MGGDGRTAGHLTGVVLSATGWLRSLGGLKDRYRPVADPQTYGKLTLNVELAGAARLHRAASVLMDGLELSGAHI